MKQSVRVSPDTLSAYVRDYVPGSVIWVQSPDPVRFIESVPKAERKKLAEEYCILITDQRTQISALSEEYLEAHGLSRIPKIIKMKGPNAHRGDKREL